MRRKQKARQRTLDYAIIVDHFWKCLLKIYAYFFEKFEAEYKALLLSEEESLRISDVHDKVLKHIQE